MADETVLPETAMPVPERVEPMAPIAAPVFTQPQTNDSGLAGGEGNSAIGSLSAMVSGPVGIQKLAMDAAAMVGVRAMVTEAYTRQMIEGKPLDRVVLDARALFEALGVEQPDYEAEPDDTASE